MKTVGLTFPEEKKKSVKQEKPPEKEKRA